jgi:hypothetical protein
MQHVCSLCTVRPTGVQDSLEVGIHHNNGGEQLYRSTTFSSHTIYSAPVCCSGLVKWSPYAKIKSEDEPAGCLPACRHLQTLAEEPHHAQHIFSCINCCWSGILDI